MDFRNQYRSMNEHTAPDSALIADTLARMARGEKPRHRPRRLRRMIAAAAAAAVAVGCMTPALAASVPAVYQALYAAVAQFLVPVNLSCEREGIRMEVTDAYLQGHTACIVFTMQDTQGGRLTGADLLTDGCSIDGWTMGSGSCQLLDWDADTQTATFFAEFSVLNRTLDAAQPLTFSVGTVTPVLSKYDGAPLPVSLTGVPAQAAVQSHAVDSCFQADGGEAPLTYDFLALTPLWQSGDGLFTLSAARRNGQLHLQFCARQAKGANGFLDLLDADGQPVPFRAAYSYTDDGLYCRETVYDLPPDALADCVPVFYGSVDGTAIEGSWQVTFRLESK